MKGNRRNPPPPATSASSASNGTASVAPPMPSPASPSGKGTAKYTNKDGSKFITVTKSAGHVIIDQAVASAATATNLAPSHKPAADSVVSDDMASAGPVNGAAPPTGNRKKAKRRAKAAAREKKAEEEEVANGGTTSANIPIKQGEKGMYHNPPANSVNGGNGLNSANSPNSPNSSKSPNRANRTNSTSVVNGRSGHDAEIDDSGDEDDADSAGHPDNGASTSLAEPEATASKAKKSKKKKKKKKDTSGADDHTSPVQGQQSAASRSSLSKEKIWNTSSQEERQRIKEFWLGLSEEERKSLVKIEKDTVLKKMKEQQKMTCSCHFCGRKRNAIEEELEGLYDSYYEELEQFANDPAGQQNGRTPTLMSANRFKLSHSHAPSHAHDHSHTHVHGHTHPHSHAHSHTHAAHASHSHHHSHAPTPGYASHQPSRGRIIEHTGDEDEDDLDDEYVDEEEDEDDAVDEESEGDEEDIPPEELHRDYPSEFFHFGNSLQVNGGILTVADDLLKNDGRKFIEMMEQLAERRMARGEDAKSQYDGRGGFGPTMNGAAYSHNHHMADEEEDPDDDEDYDSQDEEYDEEEMMTEEQRMEEGKQMFQIFAARMFEQRVLTAYREKVSKERQQRLLEELDEEQAKQSKRDEKKAKDAQKRKDKAAQKKKAIADEKARKEAEKAAELAERRAEEERKEEEHRRKLEEKRRKREAQKKAEEEDRLRKEAERQRRIHEQKEQERKAREAKERDKKLKEEARKREKEEQEKRERESRERKEKQERDKREKEARTRANEARERQRQEERAAQKAAPVPPAVPHVPAVPTAANSSASPAAISGATSSTSAAPIPITLPKRAAAKQQRQQQTPTQHPPTAAAPVPALPQQLPPITGASSPQVLAAVPAPQKAPTPMRPRQLSQQGGSVAGSQSGGTASRTASLSGSGQSQNASPNPMTPVQSSVSSFGPMATKPQSAPIGSGGLGSALGHAPPQMFQPTSPLSGSARPIGPLPHQTSPFGMAPSPPAGPFQMGPPPVTTMPPGFGLPAQYIPIGSGGFRGSGPPAGILPMPPGIGGIGRGFRPFETPPPGFGLPMPPDVMGGSVTPIGSLPTDGGMGSGLASHSRQPSGGGGGGMGFDPGSSPGAGSQPISRPAPIGRPGSTVHSHRQGSDSPIVGPAVSGSSHHGGADTEAVLGSRALLEDSEFAMDFSPMRPVPPPRPAFAGPGTGAFGVDLTSPFMSQSSVWAPLPQQPLHHHGMMPSAFGGMPPPGFGGGMVPPPGAAGGWGMPMPTNALSSSFGTNNSLGRSVQGRSVTLRQLLCRACKELEASSLPSEGRLIAIDRVKASVNVLAEVYLAGAPVQDEELDMLYDTVGSSKNGGGNFEVQRDHDGTGAVTAIRWVADSKSDHLHDATAGSSSPAVGSGSLGTLGPGIAGATTGSR